MISFVNILEFNNNIYQINVNVKNNNCRGKFLFRIRDQVYFGTDCQSVFYMPNKLFKILIYGVHFLKFELTCIRNTNHTLHFKNGLIVLLCELYVVGGPILGVFHEV